VDDEDILLRAALDGVGLAFILESQAEPYIEKGQLVRVLEDWCQPFPGFFLYYPSRRNRSAALSAVINFFRRQ
jgi:DNA-binding transcriptional LysR family regulator